MDKLNTDVANVDKQSFYDMVMKLADKMKNR